MIIAFVGSGGKTTIIKKYAQFYRNQGLKVFVTTSTHMYLEEEILLCDDAKTIILKLLKDNYVFAGLPAKNNKIKALSYQTYLEVCQFADVVLIEADGSRQKPLKYPNGSEPVIYDNVDEIVVVCGLNALGKMAQDVCHRFELVKECLKIDEESLISPQNIQTLIQEAYIKPLTIKYPQKKIKLYPNQTATLYQRVIAAFLIENQDLSLIKEEWFQNKPKLMICGGGHVALQLATLADYLDFEIIVMDDRKEFANEKRFPKAKVICDQFEYLEKYLVKNAYYVVVTRGHQDDFQCVYTILQHSYKYLGMIGSKRKVKMTFDKLFDKGFLQEKIATIHAPIGLDINAQTPTEIAISILAEIIQEKNKHHLASASEKLLQTNKPGVLCIIIDKHGSSPRGIGSMMLVNDHEVIDSIGGGALENAVINDAKKIKNIEVKEYYFNNENGADLQMICGGYNKILYIPLKLDKIFVKK